MKNNLAKLFKTLFKGIKNQNELFGEKAEIKAPSKTDFSQYAEMQKTVFGFIDWLIGKSYLSICQLYEFVQIRRADLLFREKIVPILDAIKTAKIKQNEPTNFSFGFITKVSYCTEGKAQVFNFVIVENNTYFTQYDFKVKVESSKIYEMTISIHTEKEDVFFRMDKTQLQPQKFQIFDYYNELDITLTSILKEMESKNND